MGIQRIIKEAVKRRKYDTYIKKIVDKDRKSDYKGRVLLYESYTTNYWPCLMKGLVIAKGMYDEGYDVELYSYTENNELDTLAKKMGFKREILSYDLEKHGEAKRKAEQIVETCSGDSFLNLLYRDILIGPELYDTILRETDLLTINQLNWEKHGSIVLDALVLVDDLINCFDKGDVRFLFVPEEVYRSGIAIKVAHHYGVDAASYFIDGGKLISHNSPDDIYYHVFMKKRIQLLYSQLGSRKETNIINNMIWDPTSIGKAELIDMDIAEARAIMEIDNDWPIVIIMSHCLTDAPHCQINMMFRDYYTWLSKTMEIVNEIKGINWIVKEHPARSYYFGEEDIVKKLCGKYSNVKLFPEKYSNSVINKVAAAVVTFSGTCGIEMSSEGIPVIVSGTPWYKGLGFTYDAYTEDQYTKILDSVESLSMNSGQVELAKRYYKCYKDECSLERVGDDLNNKLYELWSLAWGNSSPRNKKIDVNYEALKLLAEYSEKINTTDYYQLGVDYALKELQIH